MWTRVFLCSALLSIAYLYSRKPKPYNFRGTNVLITGGTSGIGLEIVKQLIDANEVAAIIVWARSVQSVAEAKTDLEEYNRRAKSQCSLHIMPIDVSSAQAVAEAAVHLLEQFSHIDIVINNAGILSAEPILSGKLTTSLFRKTMEVNAIAHCSVVNAFLPHMLARSSGYFISILSTMSFCYASNLADYCASKWAALAYLHCLRFELKAAGYNDIRAMGVCPFLTDTALFDGAFEGTGDTFLRRLIFPTLHAPDVAAAVIDGLRRKKDMVVLPPSMAHLCAINAMLPINVQDFIIQFFGGAIGMKNFRGKNHR